MERLEKKKKEHCEAREGRRWKPPTSPKIVEKTKQWERNPVSISTNMRKIEIDKNQPIFKYAVRDKEESYEMSKSIRKGPERKESTAQKCTRKQYPELQRRTRSSMIDKDVSTTAQDLKVTSSKATAKDYFLILIVVTYGF
uniref:Uncharacterized protein n=1 Tax=Caenorhabditis tropicalis TaxID=1561998 RepID=A0A1I7UPL4_9PELO